MLPVSDEIAIERARPDDAGARLREFRDLTPLGWGKRFSREGG